MDEKPELVILTDDTRDSDNLAHYKKVGNPRVLLLTEPDSLLTLAGRLADAARQLVGGRDLNGFSISPADIRNVGWKSAELEKALNAYDSAILDKATEAAKR